MGQAQTVQPHLCANTIMDIPAIAECENCLCCNGHVSILGEPACDQESSWSWGQLATVSLAGGDQRETRVVNRHSNTLDKMEERKLLQNINHDDWRHH